jgi:hypothetical protein
MARRIIKDVSSCCSQDIDQLLRVASFQFIAGVLVLGRRALVTVHNITGEVQSYQVICWMGPQQTFEDIVLGFASNIRPTVAPEWTDAKSGPSGHNPYSGPRFALVTLLPAQWAEIPFAVGLPPSAILPAGVDSLSINAAIEVGPVTASGEGMPFYDARRVFPEVATVVRA